ncbi:MAG: HD domain-containing protein [Chitinophagales bacterium]|nr:HD domain-containing protein [Chitinophagales bacterium]
MKQKVINDPVHGFISISDKLIFNIIEHPYFQRLKRIKQLGLTYLVYPGAHHTRFHHALGAYHLMKKAINVLQNKGVKITKEEALAAQLAILLHDIGHGPFSHTLEHILIKGTSHEKISLLYMQKLNEEFNGQLDLAIKIFTNQYHKKFLYQLVSGQLDVDRLDYLTRDSYFTGVSEGVINYNRIIDMIDVFDNELVVESKGIYSVEKFLVSRRIMYWQVYLHKTVISAEQMLVKVVQRAQELAKKDTDVSTRTMMDFFLSEKSQDKNSDNFLLNFSKLDDIDVLASLKVWSNHNDKILSFLSNSLLNRKLFKIKIQNEDFKPKTIAEIRDKLIAKLNVSENEVSYLMPYKSITSYLYHPDHAKIKILFKNNKVLDFIDASDQWNTLTVEKAVTKHYVCFPKQMLD